MTGYGVGFPKGSKWIDSFNNYLMRYRENGDLERMQRFWFTGACKPRKRRRTSSKPLALAQFMYVLDSGLHITYPSPRHYIRKIFLIISFCLG
jgi:hypothetical protein